MANYTDVLKSGANLGYRPAFAVFTALVTFFSLAIGLSARAVKADGVIRGITPLLQDFVDLGLRHRPAGCRADGHDDVRTSILVRPGEVRGLLRLGYQGRLDYTDTAFAMIVVSVWKQIPYNFIFFLSGLQGIPVSVREAALMDCRSGFRRFWTVTLPLLAPTAFFLLIINTTYALFDTFGVIDVMVKDKAANNPITLVYKVYMDGFRGNDLGGSSAQSVILMIIVFVLTIFQFRFIERRVHYN